MKLFINHTNILRSCQKIYMPLEKFSYESGDRIGIRTNHLNHFLNNVKIDKPLHFVTGFTDYALEFVLHKNQFTRLIENENVLSWSAMNTTLEHPKLVHLEYGIYDHLSDYYLKNSDHLNNIPKQNKVFYAFSTECNKAERLELPNSGPYSFDEYVKKMAEHKYVYCPVGLGLDCSKVYEAVACGCIPIIKVPFGFTDTYKKFNFVCIPGTCHFSVGILNELIYKTESPYIPEKDFKNSINLCYFEGELYHTQEYIQETVFPTWKKYNNGPLKNGHIGIPLYDIKEYVKVF